MQIIKVGHIISHKRTKEKNLLYIMKKIYRRGLGTRVDLSDGQ